MAKRILTAVVGIIYGVAVVYFLNGTFAYPLSVALISALSAHEFLTACDTGFKKFPVHYIFCQIFAVMLPMLTWFGAPESIRILTGCIIGFLMFAGFVADNKKLSFNKLCIMCTVTSLVAMASTCLITLLKLNPVHGPVFVTMSLMAAWLPDAGGYFVGSALGKHKLCPDISPKKTIEGAIGGGVVSCIVFVIFAFVYRAVMASAGIVFGVNIPILLLIVVLADVISIFGDLTASLVKREYGIKDFGNIFPGHGGMVDRFDSVYFVLPYIMFMLTAFDGKLFY